MKKQVFLIDFFNIQKNSSRLERINVQGTIDIYPTCFGSKKNVL